MANNRLARTNDDIQRVLSELLRNVKDPRVQQGMISVTRVETTGDLRYAKVWLSVYGMKDEKEFKRGLKSASGWLRKDCLRTGPQHRVRRTHQRADQQPGHPSG